MVTFILLRHGYTQFNHEHRWTGHMDIPLTEIGHQQAQAAASYIMQHYKVDAIYASDLCRACQTAQPVADALGLPIHTHKGLREYYLGQWEGHDMAEARKTIPYTGELDQQVFDRAVSTIAEIAAENDGKTVLVATHGGIVHLLTVAWSGYTVAEKHKVPDPQNASSTVVRYQDGKAEFLLKDYNDYLPNKANG